MNYHTLEILEDRIAPASTLALLSPHAATYTDGDGDHVTVTFSKSILTPANLANILVTVSNGSSDQLTTIDLSSVAAAATGTNITVTAKPFHGAGDGFVNIGEISAAGIDLGIVNIHGDLTQINAGADSGAGDVAIKGLTVHSLGVYKTSTGATSPDSEVHGGIGAISIATLLDNVSINVGSSMLPAPAYPVAKFTVGGTVENGILTATGPIGPISIKGALEGGTLSSHAKIASLTVGGDVSGSLLDFYAAMGCGPILIKGGIHSSDAFFQASGPLASFTVKGSVQQGLDLDSFSTKTVTIGGSTAMDTELLAYDGGFGKISIGGDFEGNITSVAGVASIKIGGSVRAAAIMIGSQGEIAPYQAPAVSLGSLQVKGDWTASNVVVGAVNLGTDDAPGGTGSATDQVNYGDLHDVLNTAASSRSSIGSIAIGGVVGGTSPSDNADDHYGFVSGIIHSLSVGGLKIALPPAQMAGLVGLGITGDVDAHQLLPV